VENYPQGVLLFAHVQDSQALSTATTPLALANTTNSLHPTKGHRAAAAKIIEDDVHQLSLSCRPSIAYRNSRVFRSFYAHHKPPELGQAAGPLSFSPLPQLGRPWNIVTCNTTPNRRSTG
jgi:hypothetical protein